MRQLLIIAVFACAPLSQAIVITNCNEKVIRDAVAGSEATFGVNCNLTLTQGPLTIPVSPLVTVIDGNGFAVTLSGGNTQGVINVPPEARLNLRGVTIANGLTSSSTGGGISNAGGLQVSGCTFVGNTNAILNTGSLSVTSSTFTGNNATSGGAIIHTGPGKAYITNSSFGTITPSSGNGGGASGGAIYISGTSAEIDGSSFIGNIATQGGAIYSFVSTLTLNNVYFQGNTTYPGGSGGAIANIGSNITITNPFASIFGFQSNNAVKSSITAGQGGAIYNAGVETFSCGALCLPVFHAPALTLNSVYFAHNSASAGGAMYSAGNVGFGGCCNGAANVVNSYFLGNVATSVGFGGAIDNEGTAQLTVIGSTFHNDESTSIYNAQGTLNVSNSTIFHELCCQYAIFNRSETAVVEYSSFGPFDEIVPFSGTVKLEGAILAGNQGLNCVKSFGVVVDGGYNLETGNRCGFSAANNSLSNTNPNINFDSFGFNGGPTPTFVLPTGSPAIDKIPGGTLGCGMSGTPGAFDQRGVKGPINLLCDIGSIEHLFSNLPTSSTSCDGIYNKTFAGDLRVLAGQKCVFLGGGVTGNVVVQGGDFEIRYANVGGNVEVFGDSNFSIGPVATISGNVEIHDLASSAAQSQVCGSNIQGNVEVHNNATAVTIGAEDQTSCLGNTIGQTLDLHNNSAATSGAGNTITGDLQDHNNSGPTQVFNNLIQGVLSCNQNLAITGSLNSAAQKLGQCAGF